MNKQKGIIIGILALIVTMMVGYAIFTETITINGTATAQGNFDLTYTCNVTDGIGTCKVEDNKITATSNFSKPGELVAYEISVTNEGSIPAVLKAVSSDKTMTLDGETMLGYYDASTALGSYFVVAKEGNGPGYQTKEEIENAIQNNLITINPGETKMMFGLVQGWIDSESFPTGPLPEQPKLPEGGATISQTVTIGFEQIQAQ